MPDRIYTEHSPAVQQMADTLQGHWNRIRGQLLEQPYYKARDKWRPAFVKAAITVLSRDLNPELFVMAQLRSPADASRCHPNFLSGPKALERYKHFCEAQLGADNGFYISQLGLIKRLRELGRSWDHIEQGSYDLTPMVLWSMFAFNGMEERAEQYFEAARAEFAKCHNVVDLFGPKILELR